MDIVSEQDHPSSRVSCWNCSWLRGADEEFMSEQSHQRLRTRLLWRSGLLKDSQTCICGWLEAFVLVSVSHMKTVIPPPLTSGHHDPSQEPVTALRGSRTTVHQLAVFFSHQMEDGFCKDLQKNMSHDLSGAEPLWCHSSKVWRPVLL